MPTKRPAGVVGWLDTMQARLQLFLLVVQVLAILFGGVAMYSKVVGVMADVRDLKEDVRLLRDQNAELLAINRDIANLRQRIDRVEDRPRP